MPNPRVRLTPLGGIGQVGGSIWHVQQGRRGFLVDFGADLQRQGRLLSGRLRPRDSRGLDDLLGLDLLPRYDGLYRQDLLLDEGLLEDADGLDVRDVLLTHAHADHAASLFALDPSIRVHATGVTAAMLWAQAACASGLAAETISVVERAPHPEEEGILHRPRGAERTARPFHLVDGTPTEALRALWRSDDADEALARSGMEAAGMPFEAWPLDHSIVGAGGFVLDTAAGPVVHAGDLRRHGRQRRLTDAFVAHLEKKETRALILEGTRLGREDDRRVTEAQCAERIREIVRGEGRRLVVASVNPRHVERLAAFLRAAIDTKRRLVVSPQTMLALEAVRAADPSINLASVDELAVYDPPMGSRRAWHRGLRERWDERLVTPSEIEKAPHRFVVAHSTGRTVEWLDYKPHGAVFVFAASAAYSDESRGMHSSLGEWVRLFGMRTEGIEFTAKGCEYDPLLNPSGHMSAPELRELVERVRPELLIPVHTTVPELFEEFAPKGTKVVLPENGRTIRL